MFVDSLEWFNVRIEPSIVVENYFMVDHTSEDLDHINNLNLQSFGLHQEYLEYIQFPVQTPYFNNDDHTYHS